MATPDRVGIIRIGVDGQWDIEDLLALAESLSESYGLFYPLVAQDEEVRTRLQDILRRQFWTGDIETRHFGRYLYRSIPTDERLKLKSFHYASLGALELGGVLATIYMLAKVAQAWINTGDKFLDLWQKVDKFFEKKRKLRKPPRRFALDEDLALSSEDARTLVFEVGECLGFDAISCERLIEIIGNPISALKYLVAAGKEGRKIAGLSNQGLLELPAPSGPLVLQTSTVAKKVRADSRVVEVRKSRRKKAKE